MTHDVFWLKGEKGVPKRRNLVYMVAHEPGESERDQALRIKEERHSKVETSEEEDQEIPGAAASAAPSRKEEKKEEPLPATLAAESAANTTPAVVETAETTPAVEGTAEPKEEETTKETEGGEEENPEQDPTVEPEAEAADPAAQPPSSGRVIADFQTSPEGVKTGWEVRGIHTKYTPAKVDPKAPWRVKKNIWGQVKKHPEPQSGFRLRSKTSLQYRRLKDLVRLQKKKGVITEDLRSRIKEFGKGRTPQEIKEEREEQKIRNQEKRTKKRKTSEKSEAAGSAEEEVEEEEESVSQPSPVQRPRTPDGPPPAKRPQTRDTERGRVVWGRALELNLRIVALAKERAQRLTIENWKLESPFQVRKFAADELCEQQNLKGTVALAAIRELWKTPNEQGKRGSNEACSSCDERRQAQLPVVKDYIKRRGLKGPAVLGSSAKSKAAPAVSLTPGPKVKAKSKAGPKGKAKPSAAPKAAAEAKATTVGRRPEELTRTTEVRGVPNPSDP